MSKKISPSEILTEVCETIPEFNDEFVAKIDELIEKKIISRDNVFSNGRSPFLYFFNIFTLFLYVFFMIYAIKIGGIGFFLLGFALWIVLFFFSSYVNFEILHKNQFDDGWNFSFFDLILHLFLPFIYIFYIPKKQLVEYMKFKKNQEKQNKKFDIIDIINGTTKKDI